MARRVPRLLTIAGLLFSVTLPPSLSQAEPKDAAALELAKKAIFTDYLGTSFAEAEKKLKQALDMCKDNACSKTVKAQLHRDLGVVYVGGMSRPDDGKAQFAEALALDPAITLDPDLASPEIDAAFAETKAGGTPAAAPQPPPVTAPEPPPAPRAASGDLVHTPPPEQTILTPVPIYAELPAGATAAKVKVSYKPFGADWKTLEMTRVRAGYGVELPCFDVGSTTGELKYYIQATDAENNIVSWSGTRSAPNAVPIKTALDGDPPHLPGQAPPARCADPGDCPPEFPGCKSQGGETRPCEETGDCPQEPAAGAAKKNWLSAALQQDFLFYGGTTEVCSGGNEYVCFRDSGDYYDAIPVEGKGGEVAGGIGLSTTRIMAGYDRVIGPITLGVRVGFAIGGGPAAPGGNGFFPVHGEARVAYFFGSDPFGRKGLRPYVTLGGGVAQMDGKVNVGLYETQQAFEANKLSRMDAWRKTGLGFVTGGAGVLFAIVPRTGPFAELKLTETFGGSSTTLGTSLNLQLGYAFGF